MTEILIYIFSTLGALFALLAAIGLVRMPDTYLRISVNTKAATLGVGLLLGSAAIFFSDFSVTTRVQAIVIFIFLTAPVGAHLLGRTSYFLGNSLWSGSVIDDLKGKYNKATHELKSEDEIKKPVDKEARKKEEKNDQTS
ncbi:monovalent cation/H(+) antiporter subunit G [Psychroflexus halocasei]|uniref:Multicomponent Na+:H+ antiporter subunit G n=1 Tax=Psychroflexus halocasei TaxID=908615 RepID=A0A1H4DHB8_9FLAO|nr:monovalent cation/H(+) antiporter subunit G [Psychroflexus halocasei]SEA71849.1 multicomponent Na+:H+ antiporter subunit G [Psychroflexus halocasei]